MISMHLDFVLDMDKARRRKYIEFVERILEQAGGGPFRVSNIGLCKEYKLPVITGPIGYINKMENEGLIKRVYDSNSRTEYQLAPSPGKIRKEIPKIKIRARMKE